MGGVSARSICTEHVLIFLRRVYSLSKIRFNKMRQPVSRPTRFRYRNTVGIFFVRYIKTDTNRPFFSASLVSAVENWVQ